MECGDRSSWVRRAVIFSGSAVLVKVRFSISSRQRADRRRTTVRSVYYQLPRCVGSEISESQSQRTVHPNGPDLPTAVQRSSTARLTRACIIRRHRTALSALPGRQPRGGRDATIAATAAAARAGSLPPAPHQSPRGRTYAPTRPQYKRFESTLSSARRSRSQEALACTPRPKTTPQRARLRWPQHRAEQWLQTQRGWCCSVSAPLAPPRAGRPTG